MALLFQMSPTSLTQTICRHIYVQPCYVMEWLLVKTGGVWEHGIGESILGLNEMK